MHQQFSLFSTSWHDQLVRQDLDTNGQYVGCMGLESEVCIVAGHQVFGPNLSQAVLQLMENQQIQERPFDNIVPVINAFTGIISIYYSSNFLLGLVETTNSDLMIMQVAHSMCPTFASKTSFSNCKSSASTLGLSTYIV